MKNRPRLNTRLAIGTDCQTSFSITDGFLLLQHMSKLLLLIIINSSSSSSSAASAAATQLSSQVSQSVRLRFRASVAAASAQDRLRKAEPFEHLLINGRQQVAVGLGQMHFLHREIGVKVPHVRWRQLRTQTVPTTLISSVASSQSLGVRARVLKNIQDLTVLV